MNPAEPDNWQSNIRETLDDHIKVLIDSSDYNSLRGYLLAKKPIQSIIDGISEQLEEDRLEMMAIQHRKARKTIPDEAALEKEIASIDRRIENRFDQYMTEVKIRCYCQFYDQVKKVVREKNASRLTSEEYAALSRIMEHLYREQSLELFSLLTTGLAQIDKDKEPFADRIAYLEQVMRDRNELNREHEEIVRDKIQSIKWILLLSAAIILAACVASVVCLMMASAALLIYPVAFFICGFIGLLSAAMLRYEANSHLDSITENNKEIMHCQSLRDEQEKEIIIREGKASMKAAARSALGKNLQLTANDVNDIPTLTAEAYKLAEGVTVEPAAIPVSSASCSTWGIFGSTASPCGSSGSETTLAHQPGF